MKMCIIKMIDPKGFILNLSFSVLTQTPSWMKLWEQEILHCPKLTITFAGLHYSNDSTYIMLQSFSKSLSGIKMDYLFLMHKWLDVWEGGFFSFFLSKIGYRWRCDSTDLSFEVKRKSFWGVWFVFEGSESFYCSPVRNFCLSLGLSQIPCSRHPLCLFPSVPPILLLRFSTFKINVVFNLYENKYSKVKCLVIPIENLFSQPEQNFKP